MNIIKLIIGFFVSLFSKGKSILLIVDPQNDFINGSLAVKTAEEKMEALAKFLEKIPSKRYTNVIITKDFHPENHCSFSEWPPHCVQGTKGSQIYDKVYKACTSKFNTLLLTKGVNKDKEEYSIFQNKDSGNTLRALLENGNVKHIDVCGICGDICVLNTLKDLIKIDGCKEITRVLLDYTPSIDGGKALLNFVKKENICHL